ncbi:DNA primase [bacterium]|nr:DNA primase [bacterium]
MAKTLEEVISEIKSRLDIVDVVSEQVILKKNGNHYWGLCPFHKEKTPSFSVNPQMGIYKCFGCGEGGDALSFIMKTKNMEFMDVIKDLAAKFGIEMPVTFKKNEGTKDLKEQMMSACEKAAIFYHDFLINHKSAEITEATKYLNDRSISREIIDKFTLGLAPKSYTTLYDILKKEFSDEVLEKAGLILKSKEGKGYIDRFRGRIIIPIQNENGDYVAFGARALTSEQSPKYLNSADSLIYNKSKLLYGLYTAKDAIKKDDGVILMEGYFDVISAQAHGVENVVGVCGTALTSDHIKLLSRYTKSRRIYLSFDTDSAGQKATDRGATIIREAFAGLGNIKQFDESYISASDDKYSCEIRVISPPEGKDPDEFIRTIGADAFKQIVANAPLLIDFQINNFLKHKKEYKSPQEKMGYIKEFIPVLLEINNEIIRSEYIKMVADALNIDEKAFASEIRKQARINSMQPAPDNEVKQIVTKNVSILEKAQKNLLSVFFVGDSHFTFAQISEMIDNSYFSNKTLINVKSTIDKSICTVNNVKELIEQLYTAYIENPEIQQVLTDLINTAETFNNLSPEDFKTVIEENIRKIKKCRWEEEKEKMRNLYKNADEDDTEALKIQMQLRDKINNRIKSEKIND